jgi:ceramide glucosyltransferase
MRSLKQVWDRQVRWAQLRRASFPLQFTPEILTTSHLPLVSGALFAWAGEPDVLPVVAGILAFWLLVEGCLARSAGWHLSWRSPLAWMVRDLMLIAIWVLAWGRHSYEWRGKQITAPSQDARTATSSGSA